MCKKTKPGTWPLSGSSSRAGSVGGGCDVAGQGQKCSDINFLADVASEKISRHVPTYLLTDGWMDKPPRIR